MDIRPTDDKDAFEVWIGDKCAIYWKAHNGTWWVAPGMWPQGYSDRDNSTTTKAGGELSAQAMAVSLLETT